MSPQTHPPSLCPFGNSVLVPSSLSAPRQSCHSPAGEAESKEGRVSGLINAIWDRRKGLGTLGTPPELGGSAEDEQELAGYERGSNHHDRTRQAQVLAHMDWTIALHCKVLSIYRSRNRFTTKRQPLALPPTAMARALPGMRGHCC